MVANTRGQVLLLGGLAVAIVFLTAIPLSNSLVVSESASTSDTAGDIDSAAQRGESVERGLRVIVNGTSNRTEPALRQAVQNFTTYYTRVGAQQDGVYVDVTLNVAETEGNITRQTSSDQFQEPETAGPGPNAYDWTLSDNTDQIARFDVTLEDNGGAGSDFLITATGASGQTNEIRAELVDPSTGTLEITRSYGTGPTTTVCSGTSIELDLVGGECDGDTSGSFPPITDGLTAPYEVEFENGNQVTGTYTYASTGRFPDTSYASDDYQTYGIRPAFDVRYVGPDSSYTETILVNETT